MLPSLLVDRDGDVVQATEDLFVPAQVETGEVEEGQEVPVADVKKKWVEPR